MCTESDFNKWKNEELIYDRYEEVLVPYTDEIRKAKEEDDEKEFLTYEEFNDWSYLDYNTFEQSFKTPSGDKVISFGYYGYD
jgi:hypothetical protein